MATGGQKQVDYGLVRVGTLKLQNTDESPDYISIVVCQDKIVVIDSNAYKVLIHRLPDGKFLATSDRLEPWPRDMCLMNAMEICIIHWNGLIRMMSIDSTDMSRVLRTTRKLRLQGVLDRYDSVVRFKDNLVVSGVKQGTTYWCIVSLDDGHVDTIHQICNGYIKSFVTTKENIIYIACDAGYESPDTGVYGFDILNPSQCKYIYKHQRLQWPTAIVINEDENIFVCNYGFPVDCIHQLTASCQLVAIFTQEIPRDLNVIFWDHGHLYGTCYESRDITVFRPVYQGSHKASEVLMSDERKLSIIEETSIEIGQGNGYRLEEDLSNLRLEDYAANQNVKQQQIGGTLSGSIPATKAAGTGYGTSEMTTGWNYTVEHLFEAWQSIEDYILEELAPGIILPFLEKEGLWSSEEYKKILKLRRRKMAETLLERIKTKLPEAFSALFHTLNKTEQDLIVQGLRQKIESTHGPQPTRPDQEINAMVTSIVYYTLTLELLKDGNILNDAESKTRAYLDKGHIFFDHCMRSECLTWKAGSIIICLKPLGSLTKEGLRFFCVRNGIKNFISDLLKRKIIFSSLPEGEMIVHVKVHCYDEDPSFEEGQSRDYTQLNEQASFTVTDKPEMIKNNLSLQYDIFLEEIEPLHFKDIFVSREILDNVFFEGLKSLEQRRKRAAHFLETIMDKGNEALAALVLALRNSGFDKLANDLCTIQESSSQLGDEGHVDSGSTEVVQMDWTTHAQEPVLCSCRLNVTVRKHENDTSFGITPVSAIPSPTVVVMHAPSHRSTAPTMECQTSSSTADALMQAPKSGFTTANVIQAPASSSTKGIEGHKRSLSDDKDEPAPKKFLSIRQGTVGSACNRSVLEEQSKNKHNELCVILDGLITEESLKSIKRMARTYLDLKTVNKAKDMDTLLSDLEVKGVIGVGNYDKLIQMMKAAKIEIGIDEIIKTDKDIKDIMQTCSSSEK